MCAYLTEIKCSFGVFICFLYILRLEEHVSNNVYRNTPWSSWTYNWGRWTKLRKHIGLLWLVRFDPLRVTFHMWNIKSIKLSHIPGDNAHFSSETVTRTPFLEIWKALLSSHWFRKKNHASKSTENLEIFFELKIYLGSLGRIWIFTPNCWMR